MCGIAGWIGAGSGTEQGAPGVQSMLDAMARRGPDGQWLQATRQGTLGHRRLAIYDLSDAGRQPMSTPDGALTVVFNGAIYNFLDLRRELEQEGEAFRSRTDTEVLLLGYRRWGLDRMVQRLRGMFAFAIWDDRARRLSLVRDRLGVKPLLYCESAEGGLAFASTAEALARAGLTGEIEAAALAAVLQVGYVPDTHCIYRGIRKLPAAHILEWTEGGTPALRRYWETPAEAAHGGRFADAVEQTEASLLEAVRLRLAADVTVGCLLSGGVDSSLVAWAASRLQPDVRVFTVATPGDPADEAPVAARTASRLGLRHQIVTLDDDPDAALADLIEAFDEPFPCSSAMGLLRVSRAIRPHATVLLTGDGGDEAFLGYPEHLAMFRAQQAAGWIPRGVAGRISPWIVAALARGAGGARRPLRLLDYATRGMPGVLGAQRGRWESHWRDLAGARLRPLPGYPPPTSENSSPTRLLADFIRYQRDTVFAGEYLPKVDRATMYHGLESRAPFLDQDLWSLAARMPHATRLHGGRSKAILRALAERHVGREIATGKKRGFTIPVERWLPGRWAPLLDRLERHSLLVEQGWLDHAGLSRLIQQSRISGVAPTILWHVVVAEGWLGRSQGAAATPRS